MASSAEGRAKWLHYANHCIIQEDYKGASGPGSLPPSSSKSQSEESPGDGVKSYDLLGDTKWWLHPQPKDTATSFWEPSWETLNIQEEFSKIKAVIGDTSQKKPTQDDHLLISEMESQLINKTEPWWDLNDLASFVSDKPNSDILRPQINKPGQWFVPDKGLASLDQVSSFVPTSVGISQSHSPSGAIGCGLDVPLSTTASEAENMQASSELSKAQLLEALCHSQTRARQAEEAAKEAYDEKQHLITHFLKQASQLFAYKQWFHILQLETSLRNRKYPPIYTCFLDFVPWVPLKGKQQKKGRCKPAKTKPSSPRYKFGKSFGSIVLGLSLAGAGLLLGWTLGWLFR